MLDDVLPEVHFYQGNRCNRQCPFCTVNGSPRGWFAEHSSEALALAVGLVDPESVIKIYGGEPTLQVQVTSRMMRGLRELGFRGQLCLFSNGDRAEDLVELLEVSPPACVSLNHSVYHGRGVPPLGESQRGTLAAYERAHPGSVVIGHEEYYASGRATDLDLETRAECPRCMPAILPDGRVHACPFAVERDHPAYWLGRPDTPPPLIVKRVSQFLEWIDGPHAALARELAVDACTVCAEHLGRLPRPLSAGGANEG